MAIAETRSGKIQGTEEAGLHVFRGIPFAKPPAGALRWRRPQREDTWEDVRDATRFSAIAAQGDSALEQMLGSGRVTKSEDSLYLNVWTPGLDDRRRPVMVWIHGGGWLNGSGSTPWYDGTRFAANGDVVLVSINYRLAAFGFLHLADLFGEELEGSGNLGILDQVAALEWVRDSIEAFGGDPGNVTIFGESAGAGSVGTLLGLPEARGLFHGAIAQSGAASWFNTREQATENARRLVEELGVEPGDVDALRAVPWERIVEAQAVLGGEGGALGLPFQPVVDGTVLPVPPIQAIAQGNAAGVRVLIGTNADEMTLFGLMDTRLSTIDEDGLVRRVSTYHGDAAADFVERYAANRPGAPVADLWFALAGDAVFRIPAIRLAESHMPHGTVYKYLFTWSTPAFGGVLRSTHALEIPFVFDNLHQPGVPVFTGEGDERQAIADLMHRAWISFAHSGDPSHDGLPEWPAYCCERRATMRFDVDCHLLFDPAGDERALWETHAR